MVRNPKPGKHLIGNRVAAAKTTAEKVQEDIQLAEAELHLANLVITDKLTDSVADPDLVRAVNHTEVVEVKLRDASEDLKVVTELLHSEERDRERLEEALAEYREAEGSSSPGSRSGTGSASVIEHLRELTRHKLNTDHAEPPRMPLSGDSPRG